MTDADRVRVLRAAMVKCMPYLRPVFSTNERINALGRLMDPAQDAADCAVAVRGGEVEHAVWVTGERRRPGMRAACGALTDSSGDMFHQSRAYACKRCLRAGNATNWRPLPLGEEG